MLRVAVGNDLLQFTDIIDFEVTEMSGNCIIHFLRRLSSDLFLTQEPLITDTAGEFVLSVIGGVR
jgi:hypothetical protein